MQECFTSQQRPITHAHLTTSSSSPSSSLSRATSPTNPLKLNNNNFPPPPIMDAFADFDNDENSASATMQRHPYQPDISNAAPSLALCSRQSFDQQPSYPITDQHHHHHHPYYQIHSSLTKDPQIRLYQQLLFLLNQNQTGLKPLPHRRQTTTTSTSPRDTVTTSNTLPRIIMDQPKRHPMNMTVGLAQETVTVEESPPRTFMNGLLYFWEAPRTFAMACLLPCVSFASQKSRLEKRAIMGARKGRRPVDEGKKSDSAMSPCVSACLFASLIPICGHVCLHATLRSSLRTTYNIRGTTCEDMTVSCFCLPCALTQEQREIAAWDSAVAEHRRSRQSILVLTGGFDMKQKRESLGGEQETLPTLAMDGLERCKDQESPDSVSSGERTAVGSPVEESMIKTSGSM
ncbi:PLAC8 family-domain-containing protein [Chytridium lagenaria]|nr:PLAC8 family-domain-containing protein [Chytridium lagenaria]